MCTLDVYLTCKDIIDGYTTWHFIAIFFKWYKSLFFKP